MEQTAKTLGVFPARVGTHDVYATRQVGRNAYPDGERSWVMFGEKENSGSFDTVRPYLDRALRDEEIRRSVFRAFGAAKKVYDELGNEGAVGAASKLSSKDSVRDELDTTVKSLSEAIVRLSGEQQSKRSPWGPFVLVATVVLVLFNPATGASTRKWLKDHLFGSEEEFDYSSPDY